MYGLYKDVYIVPIWVEKIMHVAEVVIDSEGNTIFSYEFMNSGPIGFIEYRISLLVTMHLMFLMKIVPSLVMFHQNICPI